MWSETKGVSNHKLYMFILQLLEKKASVVGRPSPLQPPVTHKEYPKQVRENFGAQLDKHLASEAT